MRPPPAILRLEHLQVTVPDTEEAWAGARRFYLNTLGLPEFEKPAVLANHRIFWVRIGDQVLHVGFEDGVDRHKTAAHFACVVEDVKAWRDYLDAKGVPHVTPMVLRPWDRIQFRDPFGNLIELLQVLEVGT